MLAIKQFLRAHLLISFIIAGCIVFGGYWAYGIYAKPVAVTKYIIQRAAQGAVIASVSGSGQVEAAASIAVKGQTSELVAGVYVKPGDHVSAGQLLMQLDTTNELKAVKQAQLSLQSAQLSLAKLQQIATTTLLQNQNSVITAGQNTSNSSQSLTRDYQSGFDTLANTFVDLQTLMTNLNDFVAGTQVDKVHANPDAYVNLMPNYLQPTMLNYRNQLIAAFNSANAAYEQNSADYHAANRASNEAALDALFAETYTTTRAIGDAVKAGKDLLDYVVNNYPTGQGVIALPAITTTYQTNFGNYTATIKSDISNVSGVTTTITNDRQALLNAQASLTQASETYNELIAGPSQIDLESQNISIENAQLSLQTAQQNLEYDSVRAPIAGIVASVPALVGETIPSPAATIVSDNQIAQITLNEVDAAKVELGDKATLTFDALPSVSLAGAVVEIDPVGTVSQGVVNYNVQIGFAQPSNVSSTNIVRPGMSVTANIVTQAHQDVVALPNAAVHTQGGTSYVLEPVSTLSSNDISASASGGILLPAGTKKISVMVGISNDTVTEITSGVSVSDQVIVRSVVMNAATASTGSSGGNTNAIRALTGGGGFGGGGFGGGRPAGTTGGATRTGG